MKESLILVDEHDVAIGTAEKIDTHRKGLLHRAFSLFIYCADKKMFLLQKRSKEKYHSGGKWSNSCCSHPYKSETWFESLQRAVCDELNLSLYINKDIYCKSSDSPVYLDKTLFFAGSFIYSSKYDELSEHELDYVFIYVVDSAFNEINTNPSEVSEIKWLTIDEIEKWIEQSPDDFSTWFEKAFNLVKKSLGNL